VFCFTIYLRCTHLHVRLEAVSIARGKVVAPKLSLADLQQPNFSVKIDLSDFVGKDYLKRNRVQSTFNHEIWLLVLYCPLSCDLLALDRSGEEVLKVHVLSSECDKFEQAPTRKLSQCQIVLQGTNLIIA